MKIGFQGDLFSNSEEASHLFAKKMHFENVAFIPLISSKNVVKNLITKKIDYGVMAIKNCIAGPVLETKNALTNQIKCIDSINIPIHHCLFKKTPSAKIKYIASHRQALNQTRKTRESLFKNIPEIECQDTALAAKMLAFNEYPETYGVICRQAAGEFYNLTLMLKNIEDEPLNQTTFSLFCLNSTLTFD